jgi:nicotinamide-nucleotide amidase
MSGPVEDLAGLLQDTGLTLAVAESLTGGLVASELAAAPEASTWFKGAVVAYASEVKFKVLGVPRGPVVTETAARQMARGVAALLDASCALAVTGAGGPEGQDGAEPGTVWFAWLLKDREHAEMRSFRGAPDEVCVAAREFGLERLRDLLSPPA